jgi:hypothetical protein
MVYDKRHLSIFLYLNLGREKPRARFEIVPTTIVGENFLAAEKIGDIF